MLNRRSFLALPLLSVVLACDDSTGPSAQLTASEAAALAVTLDNASSNAVGPQTQSPAMALLPAPGASRAVLTRTDAFELDLPCPRGGIATLTGEHVLVIDNEAGFITLDVTAQQAHSACAFRTERGVDITVDGILTFVAERELREGLASASQSHHGELDFVTSEGKEGTCAIDLDTSFTLTPGAATRTILGSVCGHDVDVSTSWTFQS